MTDFEDKLKEEADAAIAKAQDNNDQRDDADPPRNVQTPGPTDSDPTALPIKGA